MSCLYTCSSNLYLPSTLVCSQSGCVVRVFISSWENKDVYARAVRSLRLRELQNVECMTAVRAGLGSIIPLQLLTMLIPLEMELRTCGLPYINLEFLKVRLKFVWNLTCPFHSCHGKLVLIRCDLSLLCHSVGSHHVSGGSDGDRPAHRVLLDRSGDVHSGGALQVHQVCLQPGAHPFHLPLQGRGARHCPRPPIPNEDCPSRWSCR